MNGANSPQQYEAFDSGVLHAANRRDDIIATEQAVMEAIGRRGYDPASQFAIRLALEEGLVNAFLHGHRGLPEDTSVTIRYHVSDDDVEIEITDQGLGFNPKNVADPTLDENLELPSGRGLMLIRAYMNAGVHHENGGTTLVMKYRKHAEDGDGSARSHTT